MRFGKRSLALVALVLFLSATLASAYVGLTPKWTRKYYEAGTNLRSACTFGSSGGYMVAVGSNSSGNPKAIKTTDYGNTWSHITNLESAAAGHHLTGVWCVNSSTWYAVGWKAASPNKQRGAVWKSADGGSNWTLQTIPYPDSIPFYDVMFSRGSYTNYGYIAAGEGWVYRTANGGANWSREFADGTYGHHYLGIWADPNDPAKAWAVGDAGTGTSAKGIVAKRTGSGWTNRKPLSSNNLDFYDVLTYTDFNQAYVSATKGYEADTIPGTAWNGAQVKPAQQTFYGIGGGAGSSLYNGLAGSEGLIVQLDFNGNYMQTEMDSVDFDLHDMSVFRTDLGVFYAAVAVGQDGRVFWGGASGSGLGGPTISSTPGDKYITVTVHNNDPGNPLYQVVLEKSADNAEGEWSYLTTIYNIPPGGTAYFDDHGAQNNINYFYRIQSSLKTGYDTYNRPNNGYQLPSPPLAPSNLSVYDIEGDDGGGLWLIWNSNWTGYAAIYRSEGGGPYVCVQTLGVSSGQMWWFDINALTGEQKTYKICNRDFQSGGGPVSNWHYSTPCDPASGTAVDNLAPATPTGLAGQHDLNINRVRLMWSLASQRDVAGWNVYRSTSAGGTYSKVNNTPVPRPSYIDAPGVSGMWVYYKIRAVDRSGSTSALTGYVAVYVPFPTKQGGGGQSGGLVEGDLNYALFPASPQPSAGSVNLSYSLPEPAKVSLLVYDVQGRRVRTLTSGSEAPGFHSVAWDGKDDVGKPVSGGVYFYRLEAGAFSQTRKLVLVR